MGFDFYREWIDSKMALNDYFEKVALPRQKVREAIDEIINNWIKLSEKWKKEDVKVESRLCLLKAIETIECLRDVKLGLDDEVRK
jgi:chemotaxis protein CheY-P-specific phosphatase CheC